MRVSHKPRLLDAEFAFFIDDGIVHGDSDDVGDEHIVRAERHNVRDLAFKSDRTIRDGRAGNGNRRRPAKPARLEFVNILPRYDPCAVNGTNEF